MFFPRYCDKITSKSKLKKEGLFVCLCLFVHIIVGGYSSLGQGLLTWCPWEWRRQWGRLTVRSLDLVQGPSPRNGPALSGQVSPPLWIIKIILQRPAQRPVSPGLQVSRWLLKLSSTSLQLEDLFYLLLFLSVLKVRRVFLLPASAFLPKPTWYFVGSQYSWPTHNVPWFCKTIVFFLI